MLLTIPDFPLDQLASLLPLDGLLRSAGLVARISALDTGEVIELRRPREPNHALWFLSPAEGGLVVLLEMPSGADRAFPGIEAAIRWVVSAALGDAGHDEWQA